MGVILTSISYHFFVLGTCKFFLSSSSEIGWLLGTLPVCFMASPNSSVNLSVGWLAQGSMMACAVLSKGLGIMWALGESNTVTETLEHTLQNPWGPWKTVQFLHSGLCPTLLSTHCVLWGSWWHWWLNFIHGHSLRALLSPAHAAGEWAKDWSRVGMHASLTVVASLWRSRGKGSMELYCAWADKYLYPSLPVLPQQGLLAAVTTRPSSDNDDDDGPKDKRSTSSI